MRSSISGKEETKARIHVASHDWPSGAHVWGFTPWHSLNNAYRVYIFKSYWLHAKGGGSYFSAFWSPRHAVIFEMRRHMFHIRNYENNLSLPFRMLSTKEVLARSTSTNFCYAEQTKK